MENKSLSEQLQEHFDSTSKEDLEKEWNDMETVKWSKIHKSQIERCYQNLLKYSENIQKVAEKYNGYKNDLLYLIGNVAFKYGIKFYDDCHYQTSYHFLGYNFYYNYSELIIKKGHKPTNFNEVKVAIKLLQEVQQTDLKELVADFEKYSNQKIEPSIISKFRVSGLSNEDLFTSYFLNRYGLLNLFQIKK